MSDNKGAVKDNTNDNSPDAPTSLPPPAKKIKAGIIDQDSLTSKPIILIVGAGFGGLGTARQLIKNGGTQKFHIILLDSRDYFTIGGLWQFVWNGRLPTMDVVRFPLRDAQLEGIDLRTRTSVQHWQPQHQTVELDDGSILSYQHLVLACGVLSDPTSIPGIENHVNICSEDMVPQQGKELQQLIAKAKTEKVTFVLGISFYPYKCPPAPFEITFLVDEALRNANVRDNVRMCMTCPVDWPMPPATKQPFLDELKGRNIEFISDRVMDKVEGNTIHFESGHCLDFTTLWSVWPIRVPDFVKEAIPLNSSGFVTVEDKVINSIPNVPNSYVIGDCCTVPYGPSGDCFALPKAGEFAWRMAESVADALVDDRKPANRKGECVAEAGFNKGLVLKQNLSDVCNDPVSGLPEVKVGTTNKGTDIKIGWVNRYLKEIFGDRVKPFELNGTR